MLTTLAHATIAADHQTALIAEADRVRAARECRPGKTSRRLERPAGHRWTLRRRQPLSVSR